MGWVTKTLGAVTLCAVVAASSLHANEITRVDKLVWKPGHRYVVKKPVDRIFYTMCDRINLDYDLPAYTKPTTFPVYCFTDKYDDGVIDKAEVRLYRVHPGEGLPRQKVPTHSFYITVFKLEDLYWGFKKGEFIKDGYGMMRDVDEIFEGIHGSSLHDLIKKDEKQTDPS